tara:strand:+ start:4164 stop:5708 length:1545 start_codon:yes stop_codon:yes gene_type:complete
MSEMAMLFKETQLHESLLQNLDKIGFQECTAIQEKSIPALIEGKDLSGLAQTGTGKTAAFLLPLMHRFLRAKEEKKNPSDEPSDQKTFDYFTKYQDREFALVLVPTRELAEQVLKAFEDFSQGLDLKACATYGGMDIEAQKQKLKAGVDFLIATPGRLIDLYKSHHVDLKQVRAIVFDEADRMFDMGFKDEMVYLLQRIPKNRQFLMFSATLNFDVLTVAYQFEANPIEVQIDRDQPTAENVDHYVFHISQKDKASYLLSLLKKEKPRQTIVFSNFRHQIDKIVHFLNKNGYPAMGISSLLNQNQRNRVLEQFKAENQSNIMVATDVAARGLDIKGVDLVINFELPDDAENYVHRIGRTGRAGDIGKAYSLACDLDVDSLQRIEKYLKEKVEIGWLDDEEIVKEYKSFPSVQRSSGKQQNRNKSRNKSGAKNSGKRSNASSSSRRSEQKPYKKKSTKKHSSSKRRNGPSKKSSHSRKKTTRSQGTQNVARQQTPAAKKSGGLLKKIGRALGLSR